VHRQRVRTDHDDARARRDELLENIEEVLVQPAARLRARAAGDAPYRRLRA
jgi:hypothetical protein